MVTAHTNGPSTIPAASSVPDAAFPDRQVGRRLGDLGQQ